MDLIRTNLVERKGTGKPSLSSTQCLKLPHIKKMPQLGACQKHLCPHLHRTANKIEAETTNRTTEVLEGDSNIFQTVMERALPSLVQF